LSLSFVSTALGILLSSSAFPSPALSAPFHSAQQRAPAIAGTVVDESGGVISGAAVTLHTATGERRTFSDTAGQFVFQEVPGGPATLTVTFEAFAPATVRLDEPRDAVRVVLRPIPVTEAVIVRAPSSSASRTTAGTRTDTPLRDVPQAVTVVGRDLIADQSMRSMAEVVNYVPGVGMAQGEGHRDAPILRGSTSTSDFFVDGMRDDTQYLRDVYNVERIEVLKGPNGMIFGRGGIGGVINRVTRQAGWSGSRELSLQGGTSGDRRLTADVGRAVNDGVAVRMTGMFENSATYRDQVDVERYGVNPTAAFALGANTTLNAGYEFFRDQRTTDRGIPSFQGRPLDTDPGAFFGHPDVNAADIQVHALSSVFEHRFRGGATLRNRVRYADYDKYYQNVVPGAVNAARTSVAFTAYSSGTTRQNVFNQTDVIVSRRTGPIRHTLLGGIEVARQVTDNLRLTGFFPSIAANATSASASLGNPTALPAVEFRISARETDNRSVATTAAVYVQDQIGLSSRIQAIAGLRYDTFNADLADNRTGTAFQGTDGFLSPRFALIYKPTAPVSVYAAYSRAFLPRAGEQLSSLSLSNQALDPETFRNVEAGAKWDITGTLAFTTAVYRLDHGNVAVRDAVDPTQSHLVDAERASGIEMEVTGSVTPRWSVQGGYAYQDAAITRSLSSTVLAGARLAQVPRHSFSLWNKYDVTDRFGLGVGVLSRGDRFVATDNTVVLPAFTRVDGALFYSLNEHLRAHVNVENVFDERYYWAAHNNNNIVPGSPRAIRVSLRTRF
jgi:catecholate siderophore receptor